MTSVTEFEDYRLYLQAMLEEGAKHNPSFSLRAFARKCGLSPSYLSRILSGQRRLSAAHAGRLSSALGFGPDEAAHFLALIALEATGNEDEKARLLRDISARRRRPSRILSIEAFQAIADWQHFAILSLTKTRGFQADPRWIAERLGIKVLAAKLAVERLLRLGLLEEKGGRLRAVDEADIETPHDMASAAVRENHRQHLALAAEALERVPVELREFANSSVAIRLRDVPEAKRRLRSFLDRFLRDLEAAEGEEVYQLNLQLYPLSRSPKGRA